MPWAAVPVRFRCTFGMPRMRWTVDGRSEAQTPARRRSTVGSQICGRIPVSAAAPLVSSTTPPSAVVFRSDGRVLLQPVEGAPPSSPVPSYQRIWPSPYRRTLPLSEDQAG
ncbi:hypothetical protein GCM10027610_069110 [Dactylosporangium cerinum]